VAVIVPVLLQAFVEELDWSPRLSVEFVAAIVDELAQAPVRLTVAPSAVIDAELVHTPPKLSVAPLETERA
jgi:hypothetical protein